MSKKEKNGITVKVPFSFKDIQAFTRLIQELRFENRFFLSKVSAKFLDGLVNYAKQFKTHNFSIGQSLYRGRIHEFKMTELHFASDKMGVPPTHKATHGRLNPVGIPYLYLAKDIYTAVSEVRPWIGCEMTIAEFTLVQDISVINFSNKVFTNVPTEDNFAAAETTWRELIAYMFSMPFDPRDDTAYMPTQYVTERIKKEGFDGILYDSALNKDGYNVTLFDSKVANSGKLFKVEVADISYELKEYEVKSDSNESKS